MTPETRTGFREQDQSGLTLISRKMAHNDHHALRSPYAMLR
jgi:hypothetical protein